MMIDKQKGKNTGKKQKRTRLKEVYSVYENKDEENIRNERKNVERQRVRKERTIQSHWFARYIKEARFGIMPIQQIFSKNPKFTTHTHPYYIRMHK